MTTASTPAVPHPRLLPDVLRARAAIQPTAEALVIGGTPFRITYQAWEERSNAVARGLVSRGVAPGDRIALVFDETDWIDYVVVYAATQKAGAVAVPLSTHHAQAQLLRAIEHAAPRGICSMSSDPTPGFSGWRLTPSELEEENLTTPLQIPIFGTHLAEILYTSGTTGEPKGVACSHEELLFGIVTQGEELDVQRTRGVALHAFPLGTNAAQGLIRLGMHRLARTVIMPQFEPEGFAALVTQHRPTMLAMVPSMALVMVIQGTFERHDFSSVRRLALTGAPSPPSLLRGLADVLPGVQIDNHYTLTEAGVAGTTMTYDVDRHESVGRPNPGWAVRIVDVDGQEAAYGCVGEVWVSRSGAPQRSYYRDLASTAEVFSEGWTRTADLGYLDEESYLYLTDRKPDAIVCGGHNVSCIEVEATLYEHAAVAEAAVFGISHPVLGQDVAAAVVLRLPATDKALLTFAAHRLASYQVPRTLLFVDRLPRNLAGKVLKTELRELASRQRVAVRTPTTATEQVIASFWKAVFAVDDIGIDHRFVDLGGQSIAAAQIAHMTGHVLAVEVSPDVVYETGTIAGFAAHLDAVTAARPETLAVSRRLPDGVAPQLHLVVERFASAPRDQRLRLLLDYAGQLPPLPAELTMRGRTMERVAECVVPLFLAVDVSTEQRVRLHFHAPVDAPTTRGFAGILWAALDGSTVAEILVAPDDFYTPMGLAEVVSASRVGGLGSMLGRVKRQVRDQTSLSATALDGAEAKL